MHLPGISTNQPTFNSTATPPKTNNRTQPIIEGILTLLSDFWAAQRKSHRHHPHQPTPAAAAAATTNAVAPSPTRGGAKTTTIGDLGTAALAEARRRVEAALVSSYGGGGKGRGRGMAVGMAGWRFGSCRGCWGWAGGRMVARRGARRGICKVGGTFFLFIHHDIHINKHTRPNPITPPQHPPESSPPTTALWESSHAAQLLFPPSSSTPSLTGAAGGSSDSSGSGSPWLALASVAERDPAVGDVLVEVRAAVSIECAALLLCLVFRERRIWTSYIE